MSKYRVMSWIPVEPEDGETEDFKEALGDLSQAEDMQPENKYELQYFDEEDEEWKAAPKSWGIPQPV